MKKTILALLTDSTPTTRALLHRVFPAGEFDVLWTADLSQAAEAASRQRVDLLLLDLNQPWRTGWGICERAMSLNRGTPVVILTEHKAAYALAVAGQAGAVLQKPVSLAAVMHTVRTLLGLTPRDPFPMLTPEAVLGEVRSASEEYRHGLYQRSTTPYAVSSAYRHWGINE